MADAAGDVISVPTPDGYAEARRMGRAEAGQSRWWIKHTWGAEAFYGTAEQAVMHMKRRADEHEGSRLGRTG